VLVSTESVVHGVIVNDCLMCSNFTPRMFSLYVHHRRSKSSMQATKVSLQSWKTIAQERAYSFMLPAGLLLRKEYLEVLHFVGGCTAVDSSGCLNCLQLC
jgi:hypothetical protein